MRIIVWMVGDVVMVIVVVVFVYVTTNCLYRFNKTSFRIVRHIAKPTLDVSRMYFHTNPALDVSRIYVHTKADNKYKDQVSMLMIFCIDNRVPCNLKTTPKKRTITLHDISTTQ